MTRWLVLSGLLFLTGAVGAVAEPGDYDGDGPGRHGPPDHGPGFGSKGHGGSGGPGGPGMGIEFLHPKMMQELGLSEDQQKKIKDQALAMKKQKIQLQSEKAILELDLQNVLSTVPVKEAEAAKIAGKIADVDRKALLLRVETMARFLAGLTPEQHKKMLAHQAEMRERRKAWREEMDQDWKRERRKGSKDGKGKP